MADLDELIEPATRGDPENPLRWSSKSTTKLANALNNKGYKITQRTVYRLLEKQNYSMKSNRKSQEGKANHPDRDAQFEFINKLTKEYQLTGNPVLSIDTKKENLGKVAPHRVYDINHNQGWVFCIGISSDTAEFAVNSVKNWYEQMGKELDKDGIKKIMITADCGGSNNYRSRLWKSELQKLANELQIEFNVCHFPPGTRKLNTICFLISLQIGEANRL